MNTASSSPAPRVTSAARSPRARRAPGTRCTASRASPDRARALEAMGVKPVVGDLADTDELDRRAAELRRPSCTPRSMPRPARAKRTRTRSRRSASPRSTAACAACSTPAASGCTARAAPTPIDETTPLKPLELVQWRVAHEEIALDLSAHDVRTVDPAARHGVRRAPRHPGRLVRRGAREARRSPTPATARSTGPWCTATTSRTPTRWRSSTASTASATCSPTIRATR